MSFERTIPDPDTLIAERPGVKLYAYLASCPLYAQVRIIAPGIVGRRTSFWAGWVIAEQRWGAGRDAKILPAELLEWAGNAIKGVYPDVETATGLNPEEIKELQAEQAAKRKKFDAARRK